MDSIWSFLVALLTPGSEALLRFAGPWRSILWSTISIQMQWAIIVAAVVIPLALAVACLSSKHGRERRLGKLVLLFLLVSWGNFAHLSGLIWYVRPLGGNYGIADGTSYATAWNGTVAVLYDVSHVTSGDTLKPCGTFAEQDSTSDATIFSTSAGATLDGDCSANGDLKKAVLNAAGTKHYGILCQTATQCVGQTWKNFIINGMDTRGLYVRSDLNPAAVTNVTITGVEIYDTLGTDIGPQAIFAAGSGMWIHHNIIKRSSDDSVHLEGDNALVEYNKFVNPAYNVSTDTGDCVQIITQADNSIIRWNTCDHTNQWTKQCFIITGDENLTTGDPGATDNNAEISNNECYYPTKGTGISSITKPIYSSVPNTIIKGNLIVGGHFAIYAMGAGSTVTSNIMVKQLNRGVDTVDLTTTGTKLVANNVVSESGSECYHIGGAGNTINVYNNVAINCPTAYKKNGTPTVTQSNNAVFNSTVDEAGGFGSLAINSNPMFVGGNAPTTAIGFELKPTSPLRGAGKCYLTTGCAYADYFGFRGRIPIDVGPLQRN